jgi:hypothetical protein
MQDQMVRPEVHDYSIAQVFPRLGETGTRSSTSANTEDWLHGQFDERSYKAKPRRYFVRP